MLTQATDSRNVLETRARLLLISDHPIGRIGLEVCLRKQSGAMLCPILSTAREALSLLRELQPNLIILDVSFPSRNHLGHVKDLSGASPGVPILAFSNQAEPLYAERALRLGARGYVAEHTGAEQFLLAVNQLLGGHVFVPKEAADKMLLGTAGGKNGSSSPLRLLSERELQVFEMIGEGRSINEVSRELGISRKTVGAHRSHMRQKLGFRTAHELLEGAFLWVQAQKP